MRDGPTAVRIQSTVNVEGSPLNHVAQAQPRSQREALLGSRICPGSRGDRGRVLPDVRAMPILLHDGAPSDPLDCRPEIDPARCEDRAQGGRSEREGRVLGDTKVPVS
jgi:hypothetical protein